MNIPGLSSITKLADIGGAVKDVVNGLLPKQLGVVGDVAGAVVDFKSGNVVGAVQHGLEAVRDLPQAGGLLHANAKHAIARGPRFEPSPPPLMSRAGKPFDLGALLKAIKALVAALHAQRSAATDKPAASSTANAASPGGTGATARNETAVATHDDNHGSTARRASSSGTTTVTVRTTTVERSPWRGEPRTPVPADKPAGTSPVGGASASAAANVASAASAMSSSSSSSAAPATSAPAASTPAASTPATSTPASTPAASTPAASTTKPAASASTGQTISSMAQLDSMSDSAIRDAVIHGRISPEIAKDQGAMMAIQQRMQAISEMNNLMTAMMRALHDMQMAIIQNIRI